MVGILVHGNNHFILSGPRPNEESALALARHFSLIKIGSPISLAYEQWQIRNQEFRENLHWAVIVPGDREPSPGVVKLLAELSSCGSFIETTSGNCCASSPRPASYGLFIRRGVDRFPDQTGVPSMCS